MILNKDNDMNYCYLNFHTYCRSVRRIIW